MNQQKLPFRAVPTEERYNAETLAAMQEAMDISSGKIPAKRYDSAEEMLKDIFAEIEAEEKEEAERKDKAAKKTQKPKVRKTA